MTPSDARRWPPWDPTTRSYDAATLCWVHGRLRLFSWVTPRPKEPEGDSLQIAFRVADAEAGTTLLAGFRLEPTHEIQRPAGGSFGGTAVQAYVSRFPLDEHGHFRPDVVVAVVRLWNDRSPFDVDEPLVEQAVSVERRLVATGADALPRETRLLAWITRERHPELFLV